MTKGIRYTVTGCWRGADARVSWVNGTFEGTTEVLRAIGSLRRPTDDLTRLTTALSLIGRVLDQVDQVRVDDGKNPWDFDARPIPPVSAWRRQEHFRTASVPPPRQPA